MNDVLYEGNYMGDKLTITDAGVHYRAFAGRREWYLKAADIVGVRAPRSGLTVGGVVIETKAGKTYRARCPQGRKARAAIAGLLGTSVDGADDRGDA